MPLSCHHGRGCLSCSSPWKAQEVRKVIKSSVWIFSKLRKCCITYSTAGCCLVFVNWVIKWTWMILNAQHPPDVESAGGRFGGEFWFNTHLPWTQAETQSCSDSALQVWKEPGLCPVQKQIQSYLWVTPAHGQVWIPNYDQIHLSGHFCLGFRTVLTPPPHSWVENLVPKVSLDPAGKKKKLRAQIFCVEWNQLMCETAEPLLSKMQGRVGTCTDNLSYKYFKGIIHLDGATVSMINWFVFIKRKAESAFMWIHAFSTRSE